MAYQFLVNEEEHASVECFRKWFFAIFQQLVDIAVLHIPRLHTPILPPDMNRFLRKCAPNIDTCRKMNTTDHATGSDRLRTAKTLDIPLRLSTHEDLFRVYLDKREGWLDDWALQPTGKKPLQRREGGSAKPLVKRFVQDIQTSGKGVTAAKPCRRRAERKVPCIVHADTPFGRCLDCARGVKGHMEWTECARSRGITDEEISIGPSIYS